MNPQKPKKGPKPAPSFDALAKLASTPAEPTSPPTSSPQAPAVQQAAPSPTAEAPSPAKPSPFKDTPHRFQAIFHEEEMDRFLAFEKALADSRIYRISRNAILKALLRNQQPNEQFVAAYKEVINHDGRRKKSSE